MLRCAQQHREHFPVGSSSSSKTYAVRMFRSDELPSCTCTGFMTKRNKNANIAGGGYAGAGTGMAKKTAAWCRHLEYVDKNTCQWQQQPGEVAPKVCPRCSGPVIDETARRLPPGIGKVSSFPVTPATAKTLSAVTKPRRTVKKAAAPKPPDPSELIKMAQELAAKSDDTPKEAKKTGKSFNDLIGKKAAPKSDAPASEVAAELAKLLEQA